MSGREGTEYLGGVAEPRADGRMVSLHRIERNGESWLLLAAPGERLRFPESLAGKLSKLLLRVTAKPGDNVPIDIASRCECYWRRGEVRCPMCGEVVNERNAGGYRTYCEECVEKAIR